MTRSFNTKKGRVYRLEMDDGIDSKTANTLIKLIKEHQENKLHGIGPTRMTVKLQLNTGRCFLCRHECNVVKHVIYYHEEDLFSHSLMTYLSCDCGYTYIENIGGKVFTRHPETGCSIRNGYFGGHSKYVKEEHALKILETKLIEI